MSFTLAILGRPNVGKSTLFNRLVGKRLAIVDDTPGVTRDRRAGEASLADLKFNIFDTAGLEEGSEGSLEDRMRQQTQAALDDSDIAIMLYDARLGVTPMDEHFAAWLRRGDKPVVLVANKCESNKAVDGIYEAYGLGLGEPIALSAEHGQGLAELYRALVDTLEENGVDPYAHEKVEAEERAKKKAQDEAFEIKEGDMDYEFHDAEMESEEEKPLRLAIVGRPNAGKSTLINYLTGQDRLITGPEAGLTRDSISVEWEWEGLPVRLFDTAGLRKKAKITDKLEKLSATDTLRAIQFAEAVVLLLDAERGIEKQDLKIAEHIVNEGRAMIIALNKWDAVEDRLGTKKRLMDILTRSFPQMKGVKVVQFSALTGKGVQFMMPAIEEAYDLWNARVPTARFNEWLQDTLDKHSMPSVNGRRAKIRFGAQIKTRPPTFMMFSNRPEDIPDSYKRYMENELRQDFVLPGTPIRFIFKKKDNPFEGRRREKKESKRGKRWKTGK